MITKTINLDDSYQDLFEKIHIKAREKGMNLDYINNIETLFGNIVEVGQVDEQFLRLPLDEPMFEIDANTRKINIPEDFRLNGLSVQGDHLAEIVFFSIDRYFDRTDLKDTEITINWKMGNKVDRTAAFIISGDILPGKVVFGWPIDNVLTEKSGSLTFAVEFHKTNAEDGSTSYDFNTLPANITIKDGLIIGEDVQARSLTNNIFSILTNSVFGEGEAAVGPISWVSGNGNGLVQGKYGTDENSIILSDYQNPIMLDTRINPISGKPESVPIQLFGEAYVDEGTIINYMNNLNQAIAADYKIIDGHKILVTDYDNLDPNKIYYNSNSNDAEIVAFEDIDENYSGALYTMSDIDKNCVYFVKLSDAPAAYRIATEEEVNAWGTIDQVTLYVRMGSINVSKDGSYIMRARGIKEDAEHRKIGNGEVLTCTPIIVPQVETPSGIEIEKIETYNFEEGSPYSIDQSNSAQVVFLNNGEAGLVANATVNNFGALKYTWEKKNNSGIFEVINPEEAVYKISENSTDVKSPITSTLNITEPGEYQVKVTNFQNGKESKEVTSAVYTASVLAGKITGATIKYSQGNSGTPLVLNGNNIVYEGGTAGKYATIFVEDVIVDGQKGTLEYEWYENVGSLEEPELKLLPVTTSEYRVRSGDMTLVLIIKNNYNGSVYKYRPIEYIALNDRAND